MRVPELGYVPSGDMQDLSRGYIHTAEVQERGAGRGAGRGCGTTAPVVNKKLSEKRYLKTVIGKQSSENS